MVEPKNIAQQAADALTDYQKSPESDYLALQQLVAKLVAMIAELDARTAHVQR